METLEKEFNGEKVLISFVIHEGCIDFFITRGYSNGSEVHYGDRYLTKEEIETGGDDIIENLEENDYGHVRWDQCSNWNFGGKDVKAHFCSLEDMDILHQAVKECYKIASCHFKFELE